MGVRRKEASESQVLKEEEISTLIFTTKEAQRMIEEGAVAEELGLSVRSSFDVSDLLSWIGINDQFQKWLCNWKRYWLSFIHQIE